MAMASSVTRSRRAEGSHLPNPKIANAHHRLLASAKDRYAPRPKRQLDAADREFDPVVAKKARFTTGIAVEIPARSSCHARFAKDTADAKKTAPRAPKPAIAPAPNHANAPTSHRAAPPAKGPKSAPARTQQPQEKQPTLTKHQAKVANGLKHELDRLQPNAADTKDQGRKLRSQEATRYKSELSAYFPEYDEVIGNDPKETHLLNIETPIIITDDASPPDSSSSSHPPHPTDPTSPPPTTTSYPIRSYSDALFTDLFDAQRINLGFLNPNNNNNTPQQPPTRSPSLQPPAAAAVDADDDDPLPDSHFTQSHKKAERLERSIRNTEKGRAQHEKDQIIRLLDGLQGPDWLRVMGVNGVTESKKRQFEPAREHFIRGCEGILEKFRRWAAEEKRRRLELAERRAMAHEGGSMTDGGEEEGEDGGVVGDGVEDSNGEEGEQGSDEKEEDGEGGEGPEGEPPDDSDDVDASIAKQLREEALAAAAKKKKRSAAAKKAANTRAKAAAASKAAPSTKRTAAARNNPPPPQPPPPSTSDYDPHNKSGVIWRRCEKQEWPWELPPGMQEEFTSFFTKRYQRDAALSRNRRKGRTVLAWGLPVPDVDEAEFELPAEMLDKETLGRCARRRRREGRGRGRGRG